MNILPVNNEGAVEETAPLITNEPSQEEKNSPRSSLSSQGVSFTQVPASNSQNIQEGRQSSFCKILTNKESGLPHAITSFFNQGVEQSFKQYSQEAKEVFETLQKQYPILKPLSLWESAFDIPPEIEAQLPQETLVRLKGILSAKLIMKGAAVLQQKASKKTLTIPEEQEVSNPLVTQAMIRNPEATKENRHASFIVETLPKRSQTINGVLHTFEVDAELVKGWGERNSEYIKIQAEATRRGEQIPGEHLENALARREEARIALEQAAPAVVSQNWDPVIDLKLQAYQLDLEALTSLQSWASQMQACYEHNEVHSRNQREESRAQIFKEAAHQVELAAFDFHCERYYRKERYCKIAAAYGLFAQYRLKASQALIVGDRESYQNFITAGKEMTEAIENLQEAIIAGKEGKEKEAEAYEVIAEYYIKSSKAIAEGDMQLAESFRNKAKQKREKILN